MNSYENKSNSACWQAFSDVGDGCWRPNVYTGADKGLTVRGWLLMPSIWMARLVNSHRFIAWAFKCILWSTQIIFAAEWFFRAIKIVHINVLNRFMSRQEITSGIRQGSADWMEHWNVINPILPSSWFGYLSKTNANGRIRSGLGLEQPWKYL